MIRIANSILQQEKELLWKEKTIWHEKVLKESYNRDDNFNYFDGKKFLKKDHSEKVNSKNNESKNNLLFNERSLQKTFLSPAFNASFPPLPPKSSLLSSIHAPLSPQNYFLPPVDVKMPVWLDAYTFILCCLTVFLKVILFYMEATEES